MGIGALGSAVIIATFGDPYAKGVVACSAASLSTASAWLLCRLALVSDLR